MDSDVKTPHTEDLRKLTYSELRKEASKYGIKRKMKAEKLIAAILSNVSDAEDVFSTPAAKEINSCRKNKENVLDANEMTPLVTPRRGTYSIETPFSTKTEDLSSVSLVVNASDLDLSNVTMNRGSERKLRPRKVSFMSPAVTPRTPRNQSLRNRPKTPIASRTPLDETVSSGNHKRKSFKGSFLDSTPQAKTAKGEMESDVKSSVISKSVDSDNQTLSAQNKEDAGTPRASQNLNSGLESSVMKTNSPQSLRTQETKENAETPRSQFSPKSRKSGKTNETVKEKASNKKGVTLSEKKTIINKEPTSIKRGATPNFKRIHEKAFEKMESIDDYEKRKLLNSAKKINERPNFKSKVIKAKSKIPGFGGVPFIPSVKSRSASVSMSLKSKVKVGLSDVLDKCKAAKENTPQSAKSNIPLKAKKVTRKSTPVPKSKFNVSKNLSKRETPQSAVKSKFDLKQSLSRKLTYQPYKGPLKPLTESNSASSTSFINIKEPVVNKVVKENRLQTRSVIRGVRTNRRFELQMKNRALV